MWRPLWLWRGIFPLGQRADGEAAEDYRGANLESAATTRLASSTQRLICSGTPCEHVHDLAHGIVATATDHGFSPSTITVPAGKTVLLVLHNEAQDQNNWHILGAVNELSSGSGLPAKEPTQAIEAPEIATPVGQSGPQYAVVFRLTRRGTYRFQSDANPATLTGSLRVRWALRNLVGFSSICGWLLCGVTLILLGAACGPAASRQPATGCGPSDRRPPTGTTFVLLQADSSALPPAQVVALSASLQKAAEIIKQRSILYGITNPQVRLEGGNQISVALPGISPDDARELTAGTGELIFMQPLINPQTGNQQVNASGPVWMPIQELGSDGHLHQLTSQYVRPNSFVTQIGGMPAVAFSTTPEGARLLEEATRQLIGKPLAFFLGDQLISAPIVQSPVSDSAMISGVTESKYPRSSRPSSIPAHCQCR